MRPLELARELHSKKAALAQAHQDELSAANKKQKDREWQAAHQFVYWLSAIGVDIQEADICRAEESKARSNYFSFWIDLHTVKPTTLIARVTRNVDTNAFEPDEWIGQRDYDEGGRIKTFKSSGDLESLYEALYWAVENQFEEQA